MRTWSAIWKSWRGALWRIAASNGMRTASPFIGRSAGARTASATQVRQPIYRTAEGRWRGYERHLGPLLEALGDVVPPEA